MKVSKTSRAYFMCGERLGRSFSKWAEHCDFVHTEIVSDNLRTWEVPDDASLVITFEHYGPRGVDVLRQCTRRGIPSLVLMDGILEYRNTWLRPTNVPGTIFQPALSDKVACIGRSQSRILESWGNLGKCEVVGLPRLDALLQRQPRSRSTGEPWTVLILTAKMPGFTHDQLEQTRQSLFDLKAWFEKHASQGGIPICPLWRITAGLDEMIGVPNQLRDTTGDDLASALERVDAVITTPSTAMLEGMLQGIPVALLDYHNCPHYVPAAWTISAASHIGRVLPELIHPPEAKLLYQATILHDNLECHTPATQRLTHLIEEMLRIGRECRNRGKDIYFPDRILKDPQHDHHLPEERFDLRKLYPEHDIFGNLDRTALQAEAGHALMQVKSLENELAQLRARKEELGQKLQLQIQSCENSLSFRLGRALTLPLRAWMEFVR